MGIFFNKHPNVDMEHRIAGTSYAFYRLNKQKLQDLIDFIEKNKGTSGPGIPQIGQKEIIDYRFGAMRHFKVPYMRYNHDKHKGQYDKLANFIIQYC